MSLTRRRVPKASKILGVVGLLIFFAASFFVAKANFARAALADLNPDDWSLELILFDDDVNNGRDPLTNIDWTIDDSIPADHFTKTITLQVNYRNNNVDRTYEPGELQIVVPNPYEAIRSNCKIGEEFNDYCLDPFNSRVVIGANYGEQSGYDWNLTHSSNITASNFYFVNNVLEYGR